MTQLLHSSGRQIAVGLCDRAFVILDYEGSHVLELVAPQREASADDASQIQAVAITVDEHLNRILCAVGRMDKTLAVYTFEGERNLAVDATVVHKTAKRVACLTFAVVSGPAESVSEPKESALSVVVGGDLTGDAWAYSCSASGGTTNMQTSRFLLGHTASMLTGVQVVGRSILTSDRDEKIRISSFPDTSIVAGFLFGHEAYISSMAVAKSSEHPFCASCSGGDGTVRLWNYREQLEIAVMDTNKIEDKCSRDGEAEKEAGASSSMLPSRVAINDEGVVIAVIYDQCTSMDIFCADYDKAAHQGCLRHVQRMHCATQPLSLSFSESYLFVLMKDPAYLRVFQFRGEDPYEFFEANLSCCQALQELARDGVIQMVDTVLEKDKDGKPTMGKIVEKRGGKDMQPWNKPQRKVIAKERNKRYKRRRKQQEEDKKPT